MDLDVIEVLTIGGEGAGAQHWSRSTNRPRYSLHKDEVKEAKVTHRFTCFDVAERVEADHELLFAGRVSDVFMSGGVRVCGLERTVVLLRVFAIIERDKKRCLVHLNLYLECTGMTHDLSRTRTASGLDYLHAFISESIIRISNDSHGRPNVTVVGRLLLPSADCSLSSVYTPHR